VSGFSGSAGLFLFSIVLDSNIVRIESLIESELNLIGDYKYIGLALITKKEARLWTDGRYFLQALQQLSDEWTLMRMGEDPLVEVWMSDVSPQLIF